MNISLTEDERNWLVQDLGSVMTRMGDEGATEKEIISSNANIIHDKIVRAFNRTNHWYLWQLIDREADVTDANIKPIWRLKKK